LGDLIAASEFGEFLNGLKAFLGIFVHVLLRLVHQVGVSDAIAPTDPTFDLIKLGQPKVSASSTISMFALGISMPFSTMDVQTKTLSSHHRI
jgi:hypothetical protein